jgi:hypothetical protein
VRPAHVERDHGHRRVIAVRVGVGDEPPVVDVSIARPAQVRIVEQECRSQRGLLPAVGAQPPHQVHEGDEPERPFRTQRVAKRLVAGELGQRGAHPVDRRRPPGPGPRGPRRAQREHGVTGACAQLWPYTNGRQRDPVQAAVDRRVADQTHVLGMRRGPAACDKGDNRHTSVGHVVGAGDDERLNWRAIRAPGHERHREGVLHRREEPPMRGQRRARMHCHGRPALALHRRSNAIGRVGLPGRLAHRALTVDPASRRAATPSGRKPRPKRAGPALSRGPLRGPRRMTLAS